MLWQDITTNTLSLHESNNKGPCSVTDIFRLREDPKPKILAIVYCARHGSEKKFRKTLLNGAILIMDIKSSLLSHRKKNTKAIKRVLLSVHPLMLLEASLVDVGLRHKLKLLSLIRNKEKTRQPKEETTLKFSSFCVFSLSCSCHFGNWFKQAETRMESVKGASRSKESPIDKETVCKTRTRGITKKEMVYNCASCGENMHVSKSCTGMSKTASSEQIEMSQIVLLICNTCIVNNRKELVVN